MEPRRTPVAVPLLRRRQRARAPRGPLAQRETEHDSYPRRILKLSRCSCTPRSSTPSPPSPTTPATRTSSPPLAPASSFRPSSTRTAARVGVPRSLLSHAPPRGSPGKPYLAEHHRQDATAEKAGEGPGCNLFFLFEGVFARFPVYVSELLKC